MIQTMSGSGTHTAASTFTRPDLIKMQFRIALNRTTNVNQEVLERLLKGISSEKQWIKKLSVYGLNAEGLALIRLNLELDWNEYNLNISQGKVTVVMEEGKWVSNHTAVELDAAIRAFNDAIKANNLSIYWTVTLTDAEDPAVIRRELGLIPAKTPPWAGDNIQGETLPIPELSELKVKLHYWEGAS